MDPIHNNTSLIHQCHVVLALADHLGRRIAWLCRGSISLLLGGKLLKFASLLKEMPYGTLHPLRSLYYPDMLPEPIRLSIRPTDAIDSLQLKRCSMRHRRFNEVADVDRQQTSLIAQRG